jgi:uncharacterized protein
MSSMSTDPLAAVPEPSQARKVFFGPNGIRSGWRFLIFLLLMVSWDAGTRQSVRLAPALHRLFLKVQSGTITPAAAWIFEGIGIIGVFLATFAMSRIDRRPFGVYGIPLAGAFGKRFWQGALWGLALVSLEMVGMFALHGFSFGGFALSGLAIVKYAIAWAVGFLFVGILEEFTFRGYAQFVLGEGIGFWPAAVLLSATFGALHLGNSGEGWVGALSVMVFGLFACFTLRRTGNLWFAIGLHAAGDYAETFIYSVPDSGLLATGHLLNSSFHGPRWLTGGTIGPEGSVLDFVTFLIAFLIFALVYPKRKFAGMSGSAPPPVLAPLAPTS